MCEYRNLGKPIAYVGYKSILILVNITLVLR